jgi:DNA-binding response OmpR family regulator
MEGSMRPGGDRLPADELLSVLLIEDDAATAEMYKSHLELNGYLVLVAADGMSGISMALTLSPDLIYLDFRLPNWDGFQVLERLRADQRSANIPVVILTNFSQPELRRCGLQLGALEFLVKAETTPKRLAEATGVWARTRPRRLPREAQPRSPAPAQQ